MPASSATANPDALGRYTVYGEIASGGMATIQYGRLLGPGGFARPVAIKRLHPHFAKDESFVSMFLDEARLSARIAHANVAQTFDVLSGPGELSVVMEYIHGESLASLFERVAARGEKIPVRIAVSLVVGILHGLHAAHETSGEHGEPLHIIHRDVSPENIIVGVDGVARLIDFGIARAQGRSRATPAGQLKGKLAYLASEQYRGGTVDRRVDVYGASVVLWEALAGRLLFTGDSDAAVVGAVLHEVVPPPSTRTPEVSEALDAITLRGLARDPALRFDTAKAMALALENEVGVVSQSTVSDWLDEVAGDVLALRAEALRKMRAPGEQTSEAKGAGVTRPVDLASISSAPAGVVPVQHPASSKSGLRQRSTTQRQRLTTLVALALALLGGAAWMVNARREQPTSMQQRMPAPSGVQAIGREPDAPSSAATAPTKVEPSVTPVVKTLPLAPSTHVDAGTRAGAPAFSDRPSPSRASQREPKGSAATADQPRKPRAKKTDCREPFVVDKLGIRHVKPECLE